MDEYKGFDLKNFRENTLNMKKQADLALALGTRQDAISRMEKNPEAISLRTVIQLAKIAGVTLDEMMCYKKPMPEPFSMKDVWDKYQAVKIRLLESLNGFNNLPNGKEISGVTEVIERVKNTIQEDFSKPQIAFSGLRASGKSSLINALLGKEILPTGWNATTSIPVYIKHVEDRPDFMNDDVCWVFCKDEDGESFDDDRIHDKEYCCGLEYASGDESILVKVGTMRNGKRDTKADTAVLFLDSEILRSVDLIDIPGIVPKQLASGKNEDKPFWNIIHKATAVVYLSRAISFFENEEQTAFLSAIGALRPFYTQNGEKIDNLIIVASHIHEMGDLENRSGEIHKEEFFSKVERDENEAFETLNDKEYNFWVRLPKRERELTKEICVRNGKYGFFPYSTNNEENQSFNESLSNLIEKLAKAAAEDGLEAVRMVRDSAVKYLQKSSSQNFHLQQALIKSNTLNIDRSAIDMAFDVRKVDAENGKVAVIEIIQRMKEQSRKEIEGVFDDELSNWNLSKTINREKGLDGKWAMTDVIRHTYNSIRSCYSYIFPEKDERIDESIKEYLKAFSANEEKYGAYDTPLNMNLGDDFDEQNIFMDAAGVRRKFRINVRREQTVQDYMERECVVKVKGKDDNYRAPRDLSGGVEVAAGGITAAGTATLGSKMLKSAVLGASAGALIGGLSAGTAILGGALLSGLFGLKKMTNHAEMSPRDQQRARDKIIKIFEENRVKEDLLMQSDSYWDERKKQFENASQTLELKWDEYAAQKKDLLYSLAKLKTKQEEREKSGELNAANAFAVVAAKLLSTMKIELD